MNLEYLGQRFWTHVDRRGAQECWPWLLSTASHGYGQTWDGETVLLAHRVAWVLTNGDPGTYVNDNGLVLAYRIRHRCPGGPNRICCNPAHLAIGTDQDNADDRADDGMTPQGERVGTSKLTEGQVLEIRELYAGGLGVMDLSRRFGVAHGTIGPIIRRSTWSHI